MKKLCASLLPYNLAAIGSVVLAKGNAHRLMNQARGQIPAYSNNLGDVNFSGQYNSEGIHETRRRRCLRLPDDIEKFRSDGSVPGDIPKKPLGVMRFCGRPFSGRRNAQKDRSVNSVCTRFRRAEHSEWEVWKGATKELLVQKRGDLQRLLVWRSDSYFISCKSNSDSFKSKLVPFRIRIIHFAFREAEKGANCARERILPGKSARPRSAKNERSALTSITFRTYPK